MNNKIIDFYENKYDEDKRLYIGCDNRHKVEKKVKERIYNDIIKNKSNILEIGAGTGIYSIYLAKQGHNVTACDLVMEHVEKIKYNSKKEKIKLKNVVQADALKLPFDNNVFDVVLLAGPIYHLHSKKLKEEAIKEAKRVTKRKGIIIIDYLNLVHGFIQQTQKYEDFLEKATLKDIKNINCKDNIFSYDTLKSIIKLLKKAKLKYKNAYSTDGITRFLKEEINNYNKSKLNKWIEFIYSVSNDKEIIGLSEHALVVAIKN